MAGELLNPTANQTHQPLMRGRSQTPRKPTRRLTQADIGLMLQMRSEGRTQVEIAQRLDCDQKAVSVWLAKLTDTTDVAKSYLRGSALRMAENVVKKGQARDHIQALKGIGVLEPDARDINIAVGVSLPGLSLVSVTETAPTYLSPSDTGDNS